MSVENYYEDLQEYWAEKLKLIHQLFIPLFILLEQTRKVVQFSLR